MGKRLTKICSVKIFINFPMWIKELKTYGQLTSALKKVPFGHAPSRGSSLAAHLLLPSQIYIPWRLQVGKMTRVTVKLCFRPLYHLSGNAQINSELRHSLRATRGNLTIILIRGGEFEHFWLGWGISTGIKVFIFKNRESLKV